jgi:hypothetical protein
MTVYVKKYGQDSIYMVPMIMQVHVAMLAMARAYKKQPAKRSVLFVFHGAEERGLWAQLVFVAHNSS